MDGRTLALASTQVARARAGDVEALEMLYHAYHVAVHGLARRICGNDADAEEVVQDTFLEVCRSIDKYRGDGSLWGWIRQVAVSKALMLLRRERYRQASSLNGDQAFGEALAGGPPSEPTAPIELEAALERLSPVSRAVLWLHDVEGYTHQEIGAMMGKTASFSKSQLSRAHQRLREWLG